MSVFAKRKGRYHRQRRGVSLVVLKRIVRYDKQAICLVRSNGDRATLAVTHVIAPGKSSVLLAFESMQLQDLWISRIRKGSERLLLTVNWTGTRPPEGISVIKTSTWRRSGDREWGSGGSGWVRRTGLRMPASPRRVARVPPPRVHRRLIPPPHPPRERGPECAGGITCRNLYQWTVDGQVVCAYNFGRILVAN